MILEVHEIVLEPWQEQPSCVKTQLSGHWKQRHSE